MRLQLFSLVFFFNLVRCFRLQLSVFLLLLTYFLFFFVFALSLRELFQTNIKLSLSMLYLYLHMLATPAGSFFAKQKCKKWSRISRVFCRLREKRRKTPFLCVLLQLFFFFLLVFVQNLIS